MLGVACSSTNASLGAATLADGGTEVFPIDPYVTPGVPSSGLLFVQQVVVDGGVSKEGDERVTYSKRPSPITYRALTPKAVEATNLLVSVAMSASRMADRSLRVEGTYLVMGQAAGIAASTAIDENGTVQDVDRQTLRGALTAAGQIL